MKTCLKHFLLELGWVRLSSCVVLLVSLVLASWFIANREIDTSSQQTEGEAEGTEKKDYPHVLTRIDPVEVRHLYFCSSKNNSNYYNILGVSLYRSLLFAAIFFFKAFILTETTYLTCIYDVWLVKNPFSFNC